MSRFVEVLDEVAEKGNMTRQELVSAVAMNVFYTYKIRRAVREGDLVRVVSYGIAALRQDMALYAKRMQ